VAERFDEGPGEPGRRGRDDPEGVFSAATAGGGAAAADTAAVDTAAAIDEPGPKPGSAAPAADDAVARSVAASLSTPPPGLDDRAPRWSDVNAPGPTDRGPAAEARAASAAGAAGDEQMATALVAPRARRAVRSGTLAFGLAFIVLGALGLLEPLDVDFEPTWLWAAAPVVLGLATMIAVIRRAITASG
jgi:hypothetical protein